MFTPDMARKRYKHRTLNQLNVKKALGEIENQFSEFGPTVLTGDYTAVLRTGLNDMERNAVIKQLLEWGWDSITIQEFYDDKLTVSAKGA